MKAQEKSKTLSNLYLKSEERKNEMEVIAANQFNSFYARLRQIKEYHKRNPNQLYIPQEKEMLPDFDELDTVFTGDEHFGKRLDLHSLHNKYVNLKGMVRVDYIQYISKLDAVDKLERKIKDQAYIEYYSCFTLF